MDYLVTGTRVYGPAKSNSDLDIVVKYKDVGSLVAFLEKHKILSYTTEDQALYGDGGGFYFDLGGIKINIIVAINDAEFNKWKIRTKYMLTQDSIEDREERLKVFNSVGGEEESSYIHSIPFPFIKE